MLEQLRCTGSFRKDRQGLGNSYRARVRSFAGRREGFIRSAATISAFLWLVAVFAAYYAVHKPVTPVVLNALADTTALLASGWGMGGITVALLGVGIASWTLLVGLLAGAFILKRLFPPVLSRAEGPVLPTRSRLSGRVSRAEGLSGFSRWDYWLFGAPLGLGLLSLVVFAIGLLGLLYSWMWFGVMALATLAFSREGRGLLRGGKDFGAVQDASIPTTNRSKWRWLLPAFVFVTMLVPLLSALAAPTAWDALAYHLAAPKIYIEQHRIVPGIDIAHFYFPPLTEMLFIGALLMGSDIAPALVHLAFACLAVASLYHYAAAKWGSDAGWLAPAILVSSPSLVSLAGQPYVEWALLLYVFLAFWQLEKWNETGERGNLALSAIYSGLALGVKYTAIPFVAGLGILLFLHSLRRRACDSEKSGAKSLAPALTWGLLALAIASPWYIKNLFFTGNPVYPFVFGGWNWDSWRAEWFSRPGSGLLDEPIRLLALPWEMTVLGAQSSLFYDATIGPLYLALVPLALLAGGSRTVGAWSAVPLVGYLVWAFGVAQSSLLMQTRLLYPAFPFLALIAAHVVLNIQRWRHGPFQIGWVVRWAVGLVFALALLGSLLGLLSHPSLPLILGAQSRGEYTKERLGGYYSAMEQASESIGRDNRLLLLWEPRSYFCPIECQPDPLLFNWRYALHRHGSPDAIAAEWRRQGYTHILLNNSGVSYFSKPPFKELEEEHVTALKDLEAGYLERLWGPGLADGDKSDIRPAGNGYTLYKIR